MKKQTIRLFKRWQKTNYPTHKPVTDEQVKGYYAKQAGRGLTAHKIYCKSKRVKYAARS